MLSAHTAALLNCLLVIGAFLEQDTQERNLSVNHVLWPEIGIYPQGPYPVDKFPGGRLLLNALKIPQLVECSYTGVQEFLVKIGKMDSYYLSHHVRIRERYVVEVAPSQKRIGQIFLRVGRDYDDRPIFALLVLSISMMSNSI